MANFKAVLYSLLFIWTLLSCCNAKKAFNPHLRIGSRPYADYLLDRAVIQKEGDEFFEKVTETYRFSGGYATNITYIQALNQNTKKGKGGHAHVVNGGIGRSNVTLQFTSDEGRPINFVVEVYGTVKRNRHHG